MITIIAIIHGLENAQRWRQAASWAVWLLRRLAVRPSMPRSAILLLVGITISSCSSRSNNSTDVARYPRRWWASYSKREHRSDSSMLAAASPPRSVGRSDAGKARAAGIAMSGLVRIRGPPARTDRAPIGPRRMARRQCGRSVSAADVGRSGALCRVVRLRSRPAPHAPRPAAAARIHRHGGLCGCSERRLSRSSSNE